MPRNILAHTTLIALALTACSNDQKAHETESSEKSSGAEQAVSQAKHDADEADRTLQKKTRPAGEWLDDKSRDVSKGVSPAADSVEGVFKGGDDHKSEPAKSQGK